MTAEIAILNKRAVALAADSAVTIFGFDGPPKVYTTVNKLFQLSKYEPVGIMIYGQAEFMEHPWEVLIKEFRTKLRDKKFATIEDYGTQFIKFFINNNLISETNQKNNALSSVKNYYETILFHIEKNIKKIIKNEDKISQTKILTLLNNEIDNNFRELKKKKFSKGFNNNDIILLKNKYKKNFEELIGVVFEKIPIKLPEINKLVSIATLILVKDIYPQGIAGVGIFGFGNKEIFPSFIEYKIELIINNKPKYQIVSKKNITIENTAIIKPFAQSEMVHLFVEGIDPNYEEFITSFVNNVLMMAMKEIVKVIPSKDVKGKEILYNKINKAMNSLFDEFRKSTNIYKLRNNIDPFVDTVASLPRIELAEMAESLVNLTSFKRKMSLDAETVGGPIDVALITKGDGFVWIKRKHYFKPEFNPHFFKNYYKK